MARWASLRSTAPSSPIRRRRVTSTRGRVGTYVERGAHAGPHPVLDSGGASVYRASVD